MSEHPKISKLDVSAFIIPTDYPESDGTIQWDSTTLVLVELQAAGKSGIGYTYGDQSVALFIDKTLRKVIVGRDAMNIPATLDAMVAAVRNEGHCGIASMAVSAVDNACWDLKGHILGLPVAVLLGMAREDFPVYGSGGFTSYPIDRLQQQLGGWAEQGLKQVKMKIGRNPEKDLYRVQKAREAIGGKTELFVDANGAYRTKQALEKAIEFGEFQVSWFEEPVPSSDLAGLAFIRAAVPPPMKVAAGEYGYNQPYFTRMLEAGAVDVLQADATRCGGISCFLKAGHLCEAFQLPFSSHCAPFLHLQAGVALPNFYTAEYFYDHVRIENMLFDGLPAPVNGALHPDLGRPGLGLVLKKTDAEKYRIK
jgi:L-alanine-DL-glutamate epimerase-like enolase superfamily enzyme